MRLFAFAILGSIALASWSQEQENIWVCPGSEVSLTCDQDSVQWFLFLEGDTISLDSQAVAFEQTTSFLIISEFPESWMNNTLMGQSTAEGDSGSVVCNFYFEELDLTPEIGILPSSDAPFCFGELVAIEALLPNLPDSTLQWLTDGALQQVDEEGGILAEFVNGIEIELTENAILTMEVSALGAYCPSFFFSDTLEIYPELTGPQVVATEELLCFGNEGVELSVTSEASGSDAFTYEWQRFMDGMWLTQTSNPTFQSSTLNSGSHQFRALATSECGLVSSETIIITVFDQVAAPIISSPSPDTLCAQNDGLTVVVEQQPMGGDSSNLLTWLISQNGESTEIPVGELQSLSYDELESTVSVVLSNENACGNTQSNELIVEVLPALVAPTITMNGQESPLCFGASTSQLFVQAPPLGATNQWAYQWIQTTDGMEDVVSESPIPFVLAEQTASSSIVLIAESLFGCGTVESNSIEISVWEEFQPGTLSSSQLICYGEEPAELVSSPASGGSGDVENHWYVMQGVDTIIEVTAEGILDLGVLLDTTNVFLEVTDLNGCGSVSTNTVVIDVLPALVAPTIAMNDEASSLCYGASTPQLFVQTPPSGATNQWALQWIQITAGQEEVVSESPIPFSLAGQTESSSIVLIAESLFGCGAIESNSIEISVWDELQPGTLSSSQLICYGAEPAEVSSSPAIGGSGNAEFHWILTQGVDTIIETTIDESLSLGVLLDTTSVFLEVTDLNGCGSVSTNTVVIDVLPELVQPSIAPSIMDTLCWMDGIVIEAVGITLYPWLDVGWTSIPDQSDFLFGSSAPQLEVSQLDTTTVFFLSVTSSFGCGSVQAAPLEIPVYPELISGEIGNSAQSQFESAFCFGDTLGAIFGVTPPSGGSMAWNTEWMVLNSEGELQFVEEATENLTPFQLSENLQIVRRTVDLQGCGEVFSNVIEVSVHDSLEWESNVIGEEVCFGQPLTDLSVSAVGGGNLFEFAWGASDSLQDLSQFSSNSLAGLTPNQSMNVWVLANSLNGCGELFSDTVAVTVSEPLTPGVLSVSEDEICQGASVLIATYSPPIGGFGTFDLEWFQQNPEGEIEFAGIMSPDVLVLGEAYDITGYQLATNECGSVASNTVLVTVQPVPDIPFLAGPLEPCLGSTNIEYSISSGWWLGLDYQWEINGGTITSGETGPNLLVNWDEEPGLWTLEVLLTDIETECQSVYDFDIFPSESMAPPPTAVFKKLGQDILISADSSECAEYQWGAIEIESGEEIFFPDQDEQFIALSQFETQAYHYFVDVSYACDGFAGCSTRNFYNYSPFVVIREEDRPNNLAAFPNPSFGEIEISGLRGRANWVLFSLDGTLINQGSISPHERIDFDYLTTGVYLLRVDETVLRLHIH